MSDTTFPVDSYKDAAPHLRRPFTAAAVKFKVQATWPKGNPTGALIVSYIDARLVVERLNLICPHLWHDEYEPTAKGLMWCSLTVDGITRRDVGEGDGKGLVSDALKRAGVKFGIGVSLYATPTIMLKSGPHLKPKGQGDRATLELTPAGESQVRQTYAAWLKSHGTKAFGEPLDHGDVEGAQGDAEVSEPAPVDPATNGHDAYVNQEDISAIKNAAKGLTVRQIKLALGSIGASFPESGELFSMVPQEKATHLAKVLAGTARETA
jgi:hypothetical protein